MVNNAAKKQIEEREGDNARIYAGTDKRKRFSQLWSKGKMSKRKNVEK